MQSKNIDFSYFTEEELTIFYRLIGNNVSYYRKLKNMTQQDLALQIGHSSVGYIAKAELYKYNKHFSLEQLYKISKILDIRVSQLIEKK